MRPSTVLCTLLAFTPTFAAAADVETAAPVDTFDVTELRVLGNTRLDVRDVERAVYPHVGPGRTMADVEAARDALATAYRDRGYGTVIVDIPEQTIDDGVVRLRVIEGRLGSVRVTGARYYSNRAIRAAMPGVRPGETPRIPEIQEGIAALARQSADRRVTPVLRTGATPGTFDLDLKVEDRLPAHASLEVNDRYTADTSRLRLNATASYDNLFQRGHSLSLQYQTSPQETSEVKLAALTYVGRSAEMPNVWVLYGVKSDSDVAALGTLSVIGKGWIVGGRYVMPLAATATRQASFTLGFDYKDFGETIRLDDGTDAKTPVSYMVWSASYSDAGQAGRWSGSGTLTASLGHRGLGNTVEEFAFKRYLGRPNFVALKGGATGSVQITDGAFARVRTAFQYSPQPLLSNEQFSYGGVDTVRGYLEAETFADYGVAASVEAGYTFLRAPDTTGVGLTALVFADAGVGSVQDPLPSQQRRVDLSSWGAGLRLNRPAWLDARLDWARPTVVGPRTPRDESRWHFSVRASF
jgi:hemolysin activation/secretion protein